MTRPPVRIAIDAVGAKHSGAATVLIDVVSAALDSPRIGRALVFCSPRRVRRFDLPRTPRLIEVERPLEDASHLRRVAWFAGGLASAASRARADVLLCLSGGGRGPAGMPSLAFIQQPLPFSDEVFALLSPLAQARVLALRTVMLHSCWSAAAVVVQTPAVASDVQRFFALPRGRIHVIQPSVMLAPRSDATPAAVLPMLATPADRRLLYIGSTDVYKNVDLLCAGVRRLRERLPGATLFASWPADDPRCGDGVIGLGYLQKGELTEAYAQATVLVQPSLLETVGLPMLEAASVGTPVLAADRPYAHAVCGEGALYFDPLDASHLTHQLGVLLGDANLRTTLVARGRELAATRLAERPYRRLVSLAVEMADSVYRARGRT